MVTEENGFYQLVVAAVFSIFFVLYLSASDYDPTSFNLAAYNESNKPVNHRNEGLQTKNLFDQDSSQKKLQWEPFELSLDSSNFSKEGQGVDGKQVLLFVAVMSAPIHQDRRNAIRVTWWTWCNQTNVVCFFFTDGQDVHGRPLPRKDLIPLRQEAERHNDIILAESPGGVNFGRMLVWMMKWARVNYYNFTHFLRLDDDNFLCLERLQNELENRNESRLYWGWIHCRKGLVRMDEFYLLFSRDIVDELLERLQVETLLCYPHGGLSAGLWMSETQNVTYFADNSRLATKSVQLQHLKDAKLCEKYVSIHAVYPEKMKRFWTSITVKTSNFEFEIPPIPQLDGVCMHSVKPMLIPRDHLRFCHNSSFLGMPVWKGTRVRRKFLYS